jgi:hypothetical protein
MYADQDHSLALRYALGVKRFFTESTEDLLVHNLTGATNHRFSDAIQASASGWLRASRMRSALRDYSFGAGSISFMVRPREDLTAALIGTYTTLDFAPNRAFSYTGPIAGADLTLSFSSHVGAGLRAHHAWRNYAGRDTSGRERDDTEVMVAPRFGYRGVVRVGLEYILRVQRSTIEAEDLTRHRFVASAAFPLFLDIIANVSAVLQISRTADLTMGAEDDENQNNVQVGLSRKVGELLSLEVRYALYLNQFSTADTSFSRQTFYAGVGYRLGD